MEGTGTAVTGIIKEDYLYQPSSPSKTISWKTYRHIEADWLKQTLRVWDRFPKVLTSTKFCSGRENGLICKKTFLPDDDNQKTFHSGAIL